MIHVFCGAGSVEIEPHMNVYALPSFDWTVIEVEWKDGIELVSLVLRGVVLIFDATFDFFFLELLVNNYSCFLHTFVSFCLLGISFFLDFGFHLW